MQALALTILVVLQENLIEWVHVDLGGFECTDRSRLQTPPLPRRLLALSVCITARCHT